MKSLDLAGRIVAMDALHTQTETARMVVMEKGAGYLLTVKIPLQNRVPDCLFRGGKRLGA